MKVHIDNCFVNFFGKKCQICQFIRDLYTWDLQIYPKKQSSKYVQSPIDCP